MKSNTPLPNAESGLRASDAPEDSGRRDPAMESGALPASKRRLFSARDILYRGGDTAQAVFAIQSGLVKLVSYSPSGQARIVRLHGKGAMLGALGLLYPTYEHTAIAVNEVAVDVTPLRILLQIREIDPRLYSQLIEHSYQSLRRADLWITHFSTGCIKARVARLVNFLSVLQHGTGAKEVALLSCEEMAAILGVTTESVSRTLAEFKRGQLLRSLEGASERLYQRDSKALQQAARG